jgi:hypothetical protein
MVFLCSVEDNEKALEMLKILSSSFTNINEGNPNTGLTPYISLLGRMPNLCAIVSYLVELWGSMQAYFVFRAISTSHTHLYLLNS